MSQTLIHRTNAAIKLQQIAVLLTVNSSCLSFSALPLTKTVASLPFLRRAAMLDCESESSGNSHQSITPSVSVEIGKVKVYCVFGKRGL